LATPRNAAQPVLGQDTGPVLRQDNEPVLRQGTEPVLDGPVSLAILHNAAQPVLGQDTEPVSRPGQAFCPAFGSQVAISCSLAIVVLVYVYHLSIVIWSILKSPTDTELIMAVILGIGP
jgi:hypothetical protein